MGFLSAWRHRWLHKALTKESAVAAAMSRQLWTDYWETMNRVPLTTAADAINKMLPWHVANFVDSARPVIRAEAPYAMLNESMFWLAVVSGIGESNTVDPARLRAAIVQLTNEGIIPNN